MTQVRMLVSHKYLQGSISPHFLPGLSHLHPTDTPALESNGCSHTFSREQALDMGRKSQRLLALCGG